MNASQQMRRPHVEHMRNHWWWRPGWRVGRRLYTWHLTFEDQPDLHLHVREWQSRLDMPGLDLVPVQWLHLTTQGVGFIDEVDGHDVQDIVAAAVRRCAQLAPLTLTLGPALVDAEAVLLPVAPTERVGQVRAMLRDAIAEVWGADKVPEPKDGFTPHVSLAYSNREGPAAPVVEIVESLEPASTTVTIAAARLIVLERETRVYRWQVHATVPLGAAGSPVALAEDDRGSS